MFSKIIIHIRFIIKIGNMIYPGYMVALYGFSSLRSKIVDLILRGWRPIVAGRWRQISFQFWGKLGEFSQHLRTRPHKMIEYKISNELNYFMAQSCERNKILENSVNMC